MSICYAIFREVAIPSMRARVQRGTPEGSWKEKRAGRSSFRPTATDVLSDTLAFDGNLLVIRSDTGRLSFVGSFPIENEGTRRSLGSVPT